MTSWSSGPEKSNSTPPPVLGEAKAWAIMSSYAFDCRGARTIASCGGAPGPVPMKQWYVAVTFRLEGYDVLKTRTSEKNGFRPWTEATAGRVTFSARRQAAANRKRTANRVLRITDPAMEAGSLREPMAPSRPGGPRLGRT